MPIRVYYEVLNQKGTPALYSDNIAGRPAAGYTGRIFYSPDTAQIFYDTGSTWTLLADAGVGSGSLASVCANGNTTATGITITAGGLSTNSLTSTNLTAGSVPFIGTAGLFSQDNTNFFWDNTNKRLGINTNTPGAPLDVHGTAGVQVQLNNDTAADTKLAFLQAGVGKWRIGNLYSGGNNLFHIYNNTAANNAMTINSANSVTFQGSVTSPGLIADSLQIVQGTTIITSGRTCIGALYNGLLVGLDTGSVQQLQFPTATAYIYTFPSATGTIALTSNLSSYVPYSGATTDVNIGANNLTGSILIATNQFAVKKNSTTTSAYYSLWNGNGTFRWDISVKNAETGSGNTGFDFAIDRYADDGTTINNVMFINRSSGFIGIGGNTSPSYNLDVTGTGRYTSNISITGGSQPSINGLHFYFTSNVSYIDSLQTGVAWRDIRISGNDVIFYGGGIERLRISNTGNVGVGTTANSNAILHLYTNGSCTQYFDTTAYGGANAFIMQIKNNPVNGNFYIQDSSTGNGVYIAKGGTSWTGVSDERLKTDLISIENALDKVISLRAVTGRYKTDDVNKRRSFLIAQDLLQVFPEAVNYDSENDIYGIQYTDTIPLLVASIKELKDKIENLN